MPQRSLWPWPLAATTARAEDAKPDNEVSFNAAVTTDYRYRGISQSRLKPALQGGADYANNPSGFYAGTWASTIKWIKDAGGDGNIEWDIYGGKRGEIAPGFTYDVGGLYYFYPSNSLPPTPTPSSCMARSATARPTSNTRTRPPTCSALSDSKGSGYLDVGANTTSAHGLVLNLHVGHQNVKNNSAFSYTDYKVGVTKDFGFVPSRWPAIYADTDAYVSPRARTWRKTGAVLSVSKTF